MGLIGSLHEEEKARAKVAHARGFEESSIANLIHKKTSNPALLRTRTNLQTNRSFMAKKKVITLNQLQ
jgi:hypothetical protein